MPLRSRLFPLGLKRSRTHVIRGAEKNTAAQRDLNSLQIQRWNSTHSFIGARSPSYEQCGHGGGALRHLFGGLASRPLRLVQLYDVRSSSSRPGRTARAASRIKRLQCRASSGLSGNRSALRSRRYRTARRFRLCRLF